MGQRDSEPFEGLGYYGRDHHTALEAQRAAAAIVYGPVVFQTSRLLVKRGVLEALAGQPAGLTTEALEASTHLSGYALRLLLESGLTAGVVLFRDGRWLLGKIGWFLLRSPQLQVDMDFMQDVCYRGLHELEASCETGRPEGLSTLGPWATIYEGLSSLPEPAKRSWFAFDHFYSDVTYQEVLPLLFAQPLRHILDVGGNTGLFARQCVEYDAQVEVTVFDLPPQLEMLRESSRGHPSVGRIHLVGGDVLAGAGTLRPAEVLSAAEQALPPVELVWMSQFLDCFSPADVLRILQRAQATLGPTGRVAILEPLWDRQRFETSAFSLTQISPYFAALANGCSKFFGLAELQGLVEQAGLRVRAQHDGLGMGHTLLLCERS